MESVREQCNKPTGPPFMPSALQPRKLSGKRLEKTLVQASNGGASRERYFGKAVFELSGKAAARCSRSHRRALWLVDLSLTDGRP